MLDFSSLVSYFVLGVIGWITYKIYIWPYYISPLRKIPGPPSDSLFIGNFKALFVEEPGEAHIRWVKEYGNITKFYGLFNKPSVIIADTKLVQEVILNQVYDFPKPVILSDIIAILGNGLVFAEGETHKRQKKMMNPAFTHNNIKAMVPSFVNVTLTLRDLIKDEVDKGESKIILSSYISKATLDIIGLVGFNYEFNSLTSQNELADAYEAATDFKATGMSFTISILSHYFPFIRKIPIGINKKFNDAIKVIERVSNKLMEERLHEAKTNKLDKNDLLSLLININQTLPIEEKMTNDELRNQIMTFLLAGHETTSVATSWALYFLAQHPNEQDLLREELIKAFPDKSNFNPTFDEINSLEYLNCIIKETLRLTPPVAVIGRCSNKDKILGKYFIPKNTRVSIPILALHKSTSIWGPTAENFDPKRWLDPSLIKDVTNFNYLPFITGPRSCIGFKLATIEFKILLSVLIRNFVFQPIEGFHIRKNAGLVTKPDPYLKLNVSKFEA